VKRELYECLVSKGLHILCYSLKIKDAHDRRTFDSDCWNRVQVFHTCVSMRFVQ
jgi:hypothetical protein